MNFEAVQFIRRVKGITIALRALLFDLAIYAGDSGEVNVSAARLAEDLDSDVRRVRRLLVELLEYGVLEVAAKGRGRGKATAYKFLLRGGAGAILLKKNGDRGTTENPEKDGMETTDKEERGGPRAMFSSEIGGFQTMVFSDTETVETVVQGIKKGGKNAPERVAPGPPGYKDKQGKLGGALAREEEPAPGEEETGGEAELWGRVLGRLERTVHAEVFRPWLDPARCLSLTPEEIELAAPSDFFKRWIEHNLAPLVTEAAREELGTREPPGLVVVVADELDVDQGEETGCRIIEACP